MASSPHQPNHKAKYPLQPKYPGPDLLQQNWHPRWSRKRLAFPNTCLHTNLHCHLIWPPDETPNTASCCHQAQSTLGSHNTTRQKKKGCDIAYYPLNSLWSSPNIKLPSIGSLNSTSRIHWQLWFSHPFVAAFIPLSPWAASSLKSHQNCIIRLTHLLWYVIL